MTFRSTSSSDSSSARSRSVVLNLEASPGSPMLPSERDLGLRSLERTFWFLLALARSSAGSGRGLTGSTMRTVLSLSVTLSNGTERSRSVVAAGAA